MRSIDKLMLKYQWIDQPKKISKFNQLIFVLDVDCILCSGFDEYTRLIMRMAEHDCSHNTNWDPLVSAKKNCFRDNPLVAAHHDIFDWSRYSFLSRRMNDNIIYTADASKSVNEFHTADEERKEISQLPKVVFSWMSNKEIWCCISPSVGQVLNCQDMCITCLKHQIN